MREYSELSKVRVSLSDFPERDNNLFKGLGGTGEEERACLKARP